jgi:hypothetical protein
MNNQANSLAPLPIHYVPPFSEYEKAPENMNGNLNGGEFKKMTQEEINHLLAGVPPIVSPIAGLAGNYLGSSTQEVEFTTGMKIWLFLSVIAGPVCAYHGCKRNESVGWAIWWLMMGGIFPVVTPVIAVAQGFAKPAKK